MQEGNLKDCESRLLWMLLGGAAGFAAGATLSATQEKPMPLCRKLPRDEPIIISGCSMKVATSVTAPWASWTQLSDHEWRHPTRNGRISRVDIRMATYQGENPVLPKQESCSVEVQYGGRKVTFSSAGAHGEELHLTLQPDTIPQAYTLVGNEIEDNDFGQHIRNVRIFRGGTRVGEGGPSAENTTITIHYIS